VQEQQQQQSVWRINSVKPWRVEKRKGPLHGNVWLLIKKDFFSGEKSSARRHIAPHHIACIHKRGATSKFQLTASSMLAITASLFTYRIIRQYTAHLYATCPLTAAGLRLCPCAFTTAADICDVISGKKKKFTCRMLGRSHIYISVHPL
jgi:hypothetical protein